METIEIKDINGVVLFTHTAENNSVEITIEEAVKKNVNLSGANLTNAKLKGVNLKGAYMKGAELRYANLERVNLEVANLEGADLEGANLKCACFIDTKLRGAKFKDNNFEGASFRGAKNIPYIPLSCPSEGAFVAWKKVDGKYLVKIYIPEDAKRLSGTTRKCRCNKAMVLDITSLDGEIHFDEVVNYKYKETTYKVGEMVYPDSFDENRWCECSNGIHFFVDKKDAIKY